MFYSWSYPIIICSFVPPLPIGTTQWCRSFWFYFVLLMGCSLCYTINWTVRQSTITMPPKQTKKRKPNDKCPCRSGKKYKTCCMITGQMTGAESGIGTPASFLPFLRLFLLRCQILYCVMSIWLIVGSDPTVWLYVIQSYVRCIIRFDLTF